MTTAQASNGIITTVNVKSVASTTGNNGPQWQLQGCRYPWSNPNRPDIVSSLWIEQADYPEQPGPGMYRVEVVMTGMINKQDGSMYDGSRYWMHKYRCLRLLEPVNNMDTLPDFGAAVAGFESTNSGNNGDYSPPPPPANGSEILGAVRGHCENQVLFLAQVQELPGLFDEDGTPNWDMLVFYRDEYYNKVVCKDITVYANDNVADDVLVPAMEVNQAPAAPVPPAPATQEHHCEKHGVGFNKYSNGYSHKVANSNGYCHEGVDGVYDDQGNPLTEMV